MTNKACQANSKKMNIKTCCRSGCQALQNKKMAEKIKFLREQVNEHNFIIISFFHCEGKNLSYKITKK